MGRESNGCLYPGQMMNVEQCNNYNHRRLAVISLQKDVHRPKNYSEGDLQTAGEKYYIACSPGAGY